MWKYKEKEKPSKNLCNLVQRFDELCWALWMQYFVKKSPEMLIIVRDVALNCCSWENLQHLWHAYVTIFLSSGAEEKKNPLSLGYLYGYRDENSKETKCHEVSCPGVSLLSDIINSMSHLYNSSLSQSCGIERFFMYRY